MPIKNNYLSYSNWNVSKFILNEFGGDNNGYGGNIIGILVVLIGALCFGSLHVPIKKYSKGNDGIFIQWIMSFGSLIIGFIINILMGSPPFRLSVTGGGMLWPIANSLAYIVIFGLGLAPALLLWSTTNILTGWSTGRFGLFGLKQKIPEHEMLNIVGLITIIIGGICFAFIEKRLLQNNKKQVHIFPGRNCSSNMCRSFSESDKSRKRINNQRSNEPFEEENSEFHQSNNYNHKIMNGVGLVISGHRILDIRKSSFDLSSHSSNNKTESKENLNETNVGNSSNYFRRIVQRFSQNNVGLSKRIRKWMMRNSHRLLCICLALISGFFYSVTVIPVIYIQDHLELFPGSPKSGLNYIFSHYFGVFIGATCIFIGYSIIKRNHPIVNPKIILPSLLSGAIWGCGMMCLFLSNDLLTQTVSYPILITIPGCVASIWSIFYFKEIPLNRKNLYIILLSFTFIFVGALLVFVSKRRVNL
uniref:Uncharacterized protein n=1 Tax=Meloidogyne enterolobii TaxID=390850 RepID=A0A6V7V8S6_MELEN|nr:unnamed protein product [Meloidogyne enterolobii]